MENVGSMPDVKLLFRSADGSEGNSSSGNVTPTPGDLPSEASEGQEGNITIKQEPSEDTETPHIKTEGDTTAAESPQNDNNAIASLSKMVRSTVGNGQQLTADSDTYGEGGKSAPQCPSPIKEQNQMETNQSIQGTFYRGTPGFQQALLSCSDQASPQATTSKDGLRSQPPAFGLTPALIKTISNFPAILPKIGNSQVVPNATPNMNLCYSNVSVISGLPVSMENKPSCSVWNSKLSSVQQSCSVAVPTSTPTTASSSCVGGVTGMEPLGQLPIISSVCSLAGKGSPHVPKNIARTNSQESSVTTSTHGSIISGGRQVLSWTQGSASSGGMLVVPSTLSSNNSGGIQVIPSTQGSVNPGGIQVIPSTQGSVNPGRIQVMPSTQGSVNPGGIQVIPSTQGSVNPGGIQVIPSTQGSVNSGGIQVMPSTQGSVNSGGIQVMPSTQGSVNPGGIQVMPSTQCSVTSGGIHVIPSTQGIMSAGGMQVMSNIQGGVSPGGIQVMPSTQGSIHSGGLQVMPSTQGSVNSGGIQVMPSTQGSVNSGGIQVMPSTQGSVNPGGIQVIPSTQGSVNPGGIQVIPSTQGSVNPGGIQVIPSTQGSVNPGGIQVIPSTQGSVNPGRIQVMPSTQGSVNPGGIQVIPSTQGSVNPGGIQVIPSTQGSVNSGGIQVMPSTQGSVNSGGIQVMPSTQAGVNSGGIQVMPSIQAGIKSGGIQVMPSIQGGINSGGIQVMPSIQGGINSGGIQVTPSTQSSVSSGGIQIITNAQGNISSGGIRVVPNTQGSASSGGTQVLPDPQNSNLVYTDNSQCYSVCTIITNGVEQKLLVPIMNNEGNRPPDSGLGVAPGVNEQPSMQPFFGTMQSPHACKMNPYQRIILPKTQPFQSSVPMRQFTFSGSGEPPKKKQMKSRTPKSRIPKKRGRRPTIANMERLAQSTLHGTKATSASTIKSTTSDTTTTSSTTHIGSAISTTTAMSTSTTTTTTTTATATMSTTSTTTATTHNSMIHTDTGTTTATTNNPTNHTTTCIDWKGSTSDQRCLVIESIKLVKGQTSQAIPNENNEDKNAQLSHSSQHKVINSPRSMESQLPAFPSVGSSVVSLDFGESMSDAGVIKIELSEDWLDSKVSMKEADLTNKDTPMESISAIVIKKEPSEYVQNPKISAEETDLMSENTPSESPWTTIKSEEEKRNVLSIANTVSGITSTSTTNSVTSSDHTHVNTYISTEVDNSDQKYQAVELARSGKSQILHAVSKEGKKDRNGQMSNSSQYEVTNSTLSNERELIDYPSTGRSGVSLEYAAESNSDAMDIKMELSENWQDFNICKWEADLKTKVTSTETPATAINCDNEKLNGISQSPPLTVNMDSPAMQPPVCQTTNSVSNTNTRNPISSVIGALLKGDFTQKVKASLVKTSSVSRYGPSCGSHQDGVASKRKQSITTKDPEITSLDTNVYNETGIAPPCGQSTLATNSESRIVPSCGQPVMVTYAETGIVPSCGQPALVTNNETGIVPSSGQPALGTGSEKGLMSSSGQSALGTGSEKAIVSSCGQPALDTGSEKGLVSSCGQPELDTGSKKGLVSSCGQPALDTNSEAMISTCPVPATSSEARIESSCGQPAPDTNTAIRTASPGGQLAPLPELSSSNPVAPLGFSGQPPSGDRLRCGRGNLPLSAVCVIGGSAVSIGTLGLPSSSVSTPYRTAAKKASGKRRQKVLMKRKKPYNKIVPRDSPDLVRSKYHMKAFVLRSKLLNRNEAIHYRTSVTTVHDKNIKSEATQSNHSNSEASLNDRAHTKATISHSKDRASGSSHPDQISSGRGHSENTQSHMSHPEDALNDLQYSEASPNVVGHTQPPRGCYDMKLPEYSPQQLSEKGIAVKVKGHQNRNAAPIESQNSEKGLCVAPEIPCQNNVSHQSAPKNSVKERNVNSYRQKAKMYGLKRCRVMLSKLDTGKERSVNLLGWIPKQDLRCSKHVRLKHLDENETKTLQSELFDSTLSNRSIKAAKNGQSQGRIPHTDLDIQANSITPEEKTRFHVSELPMMGKLVTLDFDYPPGSAGSAGGEKKQDLVIRSLLTAPPMVSSRAPQVACTSGKVIHREIRPVVVGDSVDYMTEGQSSSSSSSSSSSPQCTKVASSSVTQSLDCLAEGQSLSSQSTKVASSSVTQSLDCLAEGQSSSSPQCTKVPSSSVTQSVKDMADGQPSSSPQCTKVVNSSVTQSVKDMADGQPSSSPQCTKVVNSSVTQSVKDMADGQPSSSPQCTKVVNSSVTQSVKDMAEGQSSSSPQCKKVASSSVTPSVNYMAEGQSSSSPQCKKVASSSVTQSDDFAVTNRQSESEKGQKDHVSKHLSQTFSGPVDQADIGYQGITRPGASLPLRIRERLPTSEDADELREWEAKQIRRIQSLRQALLVEETALKLFRKRIKNRIV